jgi:methylglutamate dehydrogenase subunit D
MLDVISPLASIDAFASATVNLTEAPGFTLTQMVGADKDVKKVLGKLPSKVGVALEHDGRTLLRIGPKQNWVLGAAPAEAAGCYLTPLSSGRTRIALSGAKARDVLATCAAIDFHPTEFKLCQFVMTGIHHTPVVILCVTDDLFHVYVLRTFALAVWEFLTDAALGV